MKNFLTAILIICAIVSFSANTAEAAGTFQFIDFEPTMKAFYGVPFTKTINYIYSGDYYSSVSIIGSPVPPDIFLGSINYGINGVDSIIFSGTPSLSSKAEYELSFVLTDNYGALLTQPFTFSVSNDHVQNITGTFPDITSGEPYSTIIRFDYFGQGEPAVSFLGDVSLSKLSIYPDVRVLSTDHSTGSPKESIYIEFSTTMSSSLPYTAGQYSLTMYVEGSPEKTFTLNIKDDSVNSNCPANSHLVGTTCSCDAGYILDSNQGGCVPVLSSVDLSDYGVTQKIITGNLVKLDGSTTVYLVRDGKRYSFPNQKTYESWYGNDFSSVATISAGELASYQLFGNITYQPGSLVKIPTIPKVYLVTDDGSLRWVQTEAKLNSLGLFLSQVNDLPETFFLDYTIGTDI